jgi:hypothetical protein
MSRKLTPEERYRNRIKPNEAEKRNHWDKKLLRDYIAQRNHAAANRIFGEPGAKKRDVQVENMHGYHPHKWLKGG